MSMQEIESESEVESESSFNYHTAYFLKLKIKKRSSVKPGVFNHCHSV